MNVLVLFGGKSFEHEVSIITGCLVKSLLKDHHTIYPVYINNSNESFYLKDCSVDTFRKEKLKNKISFVKKGIKNKFNFHKIDVAIICGHGNNAEDGMYKAILDFYDIPSIGSNLISSAVNMDKYYSYCVLRDNGINVVNSTFITKDNLEHNIEYPVILKPARLGSSIGIEVCRNKAEYDSKVFNSLKFDNKILVQNYLENITELNISLYKNKDTIVLSNIEVVDKHDTIYSYDDKYSKTKIKKRNFLKDKKLINQINDISTKVYNLFELDAIVRIDYIFYNKEIFLNEINVIPGSLSYYLYDKKFINIINELISKELFDKTNKKITTFKTDILFKDYNMKK